MPPEVDPSALPLSPGLARQGTPGASSGAHLPQHTESNFTDGSGALFSMYNERATEVDQKMIESWKGDADGILVFTGLFSATVETFLITSIQNLQFNSQDASAFYLAHLYQTNAGSANTSSITIPSTLSDPSTFSSSASAVWVNALWFISLILSLTCALLATLLQQWARRYLRITQPRHSPHRRARIREFMAQGVEKLHLPWVVEALPVLLHLSVFVFIGAAVFIFDINLTMFGAVLFCVGACAGLHLLITMIPIFRPDSPYSTPLSTLLWFAAWGTSWLVSRFPIWDYLRCIPRLYRIRYVWYGFERRMAKGITGGIQDAATKLSSILYTRALTWLFSSLDEDQELEQFVYGVPGFLNSREVDAATDVFGGLPVHELSYAMVTFMMCSLTSDLIVDTLRQRRMAICIRAMAVYPPIVHPTLQTVAFEHADGSPILANVNFAHFAQLHCSHPDQTVRHNAHSILAYAIDRVKDYDGDWSSLIRRHLGLSESPFEQYRRQDNSVRMINVMNISRYLLPSYDGNPFQNDHDLGLRRFRLDLIVSDLQTTHVAPELRNEFCKLWNEIVLVMHEASRTMARRTDAMIILYWIRWIYVSLHEGIEFAPTVVSSSTANGTPILFEGPSYPTCTLSAHRNPAPLDLSSEIRASGASTALGPEIAAQTKEPKAEIDHSPSPPSPPPPVAHLPLPLPDSHS
ncbi:hypothetical protein BC834DRAFT_936209 [Gloeopeniophorella convolvens]|nr:hypothetical protein BC834DRAFT_936209 [Gloeopeniophorella convolvens]